jgi:hypothetical protein
MTIAKRYEHDMKLFVTGRLTLKEYARIDDAITEAVRRTIRNRKRKWVLFGLAFRGVPRPDR